MLNRGYNIPGTAIHDTATSASITAVTVNKFFEFIVPPLE
jgi:hypothetical protein